MAFTKITNADLDSRGATTLPNVPTISAWDLKQEFDAPAKVIVAPAVNNLIDELGADTAATSLGATAPTGRTGATVQAVINDISDDLATVESQVGEAVANSHTHANKSLLDTYTQTNENIADAVSKKHEHSNKATLDTYTQTEADLSDAVSKKHSHSNKALLDTYTQTESNLRDAVDKTHAHANKATLDLIDSTAKGHYDDAYTNMHTHSNKSVLDKFGESSGQPTYNGSPIGGGGGAVNNAYKNVKVGSTTITASGEDTIEFIAGTNVTLTPDAANKTVTIISTGGGGGGSTGDMLKSVYDTDNNGIVDKAETLNDGTNALSASITELNYVDGVTSAIQTQLDGKIANPSTKSDGQVLTYDGTNQVWKAATPSSGSSDYENLSNLPKINNVLVKGEKTLANYGIAAETHTHAISDVTNLSTTLSGKQDTLQYDSAPTNGSDKMVKSGGIYTALSTKADTSSVPTKVSDLQNDSGFITGLAWSGVTDKPFSTVGNGLTVTSNALNADVQTVTVDSTGTASNTGARYQSVTINGTANEIDGTKYMEITNTSGSSFTFTNAAITASSVIDVYTDTWGDNPSSVTVSSGSCVVAFGASQTRSVRIYIR